MIFGPKLWGYMKGIAKNHGFEAVKIGGASDHVHALLVVPPVMPLAKAVQSIKERDEWDTALIESHPATHIRSRLFAVRRS
jgi:REP element-mobilizing transposase RayT